MTNFKITNQAREQAIIMKDDAKSLRMQMLLLKYNYIIDNAKFNYAIDYDVNLNGL